jgi:anion-transporting  ArsA/GET3 family ATPase
MTPRLVAIEGKGGVGRSTVAAALGHAWARAGRTLWLVTLHDEPGLANACHVPPQYPARPIAPGLWVSTLGTREALRDFGRRKLPVGALGGAALASRPMTTLVDAVPGLADLVQLGKIEDRLHAPLDGEPRLDAIVLDAPATGHGHRLLDAPGVVSALAKAGPFHALAAKIAALVEDADAMRHVLVTLPEPLPMSETLESLDASVDAGRTPSAVVINRTLPPMPTPRPALPPGWSAGFDALERRWHLAAEAEQTLVDGLRARGLQTLPRVRMSDVPDAANRRPWDAWVAELAPLIALLEAP